MNRTYVNRLGANASGRAHRAALLNIHYLIPSSRDQTLKCRSLAFYRATVLPFHRPEFQYEIRMYNKLARRSMDTANLRKRIF